MLPSLESELVEPPEFVLEFDESPVPVLPVPDVESDPDVASVLDVALPFVVSLPSCVACGADVEGVVGATSSAGFVGG